MRTRRLSHLTLVLAGLLAANAGLAAAQKGTVATKLLQANGYQENGSPAPAKDAACTAKYKTFLGNEVNNTYDINVKTLIMTASSTFKGVPVQLYPMGLSGSYSFMSDGIPPVLQKIGLMRLIFSLDKQFANPKNMLMFPLETGYNCVLSNAVLEAAAAQELLNGKPQKH
jgi:hypothetical protein